jgi:hypothetical protein
MNKFVLKVNNSKVIMKHFIFKIVTKISNMRRWLPKIVRNIAATGELSDECLEAGALPMLVHFYSPVPDLEDLQNRNVWAKKSELPGIDFRPDFQLDLLKKLGKKFGDECIWPENPTNEKRNFYTSNGGFSYGCASALHSIIRNFKPANIFEIGSGNSSNVIGDALEINSKESGKASNYVVIDPYPGDTVRNKVKEITQLIENRVELVDLKEFEVLKENDILFIDSSHMVKIGSDVNFLYMEILPRLNPGVIVHIHDINLPYEYPKTYATNPAFRMFWTESYLLQAFLTFNSEFEILLGMNYIQTDHMDTFCKAFPHFDLEKNWANSGSFWIQRR